MRARSSITPASRQQTSDHGAVVSCGLWTLERRPAEFVAAIFPAATAVTLPPGEFRGVVIPNVAGVGQNSDDCEFEAAGDARHRTYTRAEVDIGATES